MTFEDVWALCLPWTCVERSTSYRTPALKANGKLLVRVWEDGETLVIPGVPIDEREMLMEARPAIFFITDHYLDWPSVLARLPAANVEDIASLIERRWRALSMPPKSKTR